MSRQSPRHRGCLTYRRSMGPGETSVELYAPLAPRPAERARQHQVAAGDRLDLLAWRYLGDPLAFHRIVDANPTLSPDDLLEVGRIIAIPKGDR